MISISIAVLTLTWIFILFKLFPKYQIDTFQAVVFNYIVACLCGISIYHSKYTTEIVTHLSWLKWAIACGILFITLFFLMGVSSQKNGVSVTTIIVKMSMALSILSMILYYNEDIYFLKILAIILAISSVLLLSYSGKSEKKEVKKGILIILFIGCGLLDFLLNYIQKFELTHIHSTLFSAFSLGIAGILGIIILLIFKREKITLKNIIAGVFLGIPNYFSIYFLIHSYEVINLPDSTILAILNILSVLASIIAGYFLFKEKLEKIKILGIIVCFIAIYLFTK
jgi:drug/metabolite transporter (DMT)-like permease